MKRELDVPFKLQLAERVKYWRSRLVRNSLEKDARDRKFFRQTIWVPMSKSNVVPDCAIFKGCNVAISTVELPTPVRANNILFDYVGAVDGFTPFQETAPAMLVYMSAGKYSKGTVWYAWRNNYIVEYGNPDLPMAMVEGIFEDPELAMKLACKPGEPVCDTWNTSYPCSYDVIQQIVQMIVEVDFGTGSQRQQRQQAQQQENQQPQ